MTRGRAHIANEREISDRERRALGEELPRAAERALRAGAVGALTYQGAGATGVVFCDEAGTAYKVARPRAEATVREEAAWMRRAAHVPGVREHVASGVRYDDVNDVLIRECVVGNRGSPIYTRKLFDLHQKIRATMRPYGWLSPEFKEDSYVLTRGRGPVLVDASMALRVGHELVRHVQRELRRAPSKSTIEDLKYAVSAESGCTIPPAVANILIRKLELARMSKTPTGSSSIEKRGRSRRAPARR